MGVAVRPMKLAFGSASRRWAGKPTAKSDWLGGAPLQGCGGEADEARVRERVAHVGGEAVDQVVLAAVRLVGDDHDVSPLRGHRMGGGPFPGGGRSGGRG